MNMTKKLALLAVVVLLLAFPGRAFAQADTGDQVVFGGSYKLSAGETLNGDLVVFGGVVDLEPDSRVDGDVVLFGGSIAVDGLVDGDLVALGGSVSLGETAVVRGDLVTPGGSVQRAPGAQVLGEVITQVDIPFTFAFPRVFNPGAVIRGLRFEVSPFWTLTWFLIRTLAFSALAVLLVMFLPEHADRAAKAVVAQPLVAGGLGLLTIFVLPPLLVILGLVTLLLLSPVSLLGLILLFVAIVLGWIALGLEVGNRLVGLSGRQWPAPVAAGAGTLLLTVVAFAIDSIACVGWLAPFFVSCLGLGGVMLTRFGTQHYPLEETGIPAVARDPASETPLVDKSAEENGEEA